MRGIGKGFGPLVRLTSVRLGFCVWVAAVGPLSAQTANNAANGPATRASSDISGNAGAVPQSQLDKLLRTDPWELLEAILPTGQAAAEKTAADKAAAENALRPSLEDVEAEFGTSQNLADNLADPALEDLPRAPGEYRVRGFESRLETVRSRQRAELEPVGLRAGTFTMFPALEMTTSHTDNIFAASTDRKSDTKFSLKPSILVRSDWSRHGFALTGEGEWGVYSHYRSENTLRGTLAGEGRIDISRFSSAGMRLSFASEQEGRGSSDAVEGAEGPVRYRNFGLQGNFSQRLNRLVATLRGGFLRTDYDDIGLALGGTDNNDDRDVDTGHLGLRLAYEVSPAVRVYGDVEVDRRTYRQRLDDEGYERSSDGWRTAMGTNFEAGGLAHLDLEVGYNSRDFEDARLAAIGAFTADGRFTWAVTPLTTMRLGAGTNVEETTEAGASAKVTRKVSAGLDHELQRHFILSADLGIEREQIRGTPTETDTVTASFGGEYWFGRQASVVAKLAREVEKANNTVGEDVTETVISVGVKLRR